LVLRISRRRAAFVSTTTIVPSPRYDRRWPKLAIQHGRRAVHTASLRVSDLVVLMMNIGDISGKTGGGRGGGRKKKERAVKGEGKKVGNDVSVRAAASVIN